MSWRSFLYRRLCRVATCELRLATGGVLALGSKFDVASAADAIVHPFYWQLFHLLHHPPASVVDCGAHCGHFTVLADVCARVRYGESAGQYTLIEPNPMLGPTLHATLAAAQISARTRLIHGLLGCDADHADLWVHPRNYLTSGLTPVLNARAYRVPCVQAANVVPPGPVDVLKVDIEGGEYGLLRLEPELFARTELLFMEIHQAPVEEQRWLFETLTRMGFRDVGPRVEHCGQLLVVMSQNPGKASP